MINLSYLVFLTISFFTTSLSLLTSIGTGANLSISSLSNSVLKLAKFDFSPKLLASSCNMFLNPFLLHN